MSQEIFNEGIIPIHSNFFLFWILLIFGLRSVLTIIEKIWRFGSSMKQWNCYSLLQNLC